MAGIYYKIPDMKMNRHWFALMRTGEMTCHICSLVILSDHDFTRDHYPVPKSKGGYDRRPCHRWCDNAHKDKTDAKNPKYLERLITSWNNNGTLFNRMAYRSLYKLQRDLVTERPLNDHEIKRTIEFLFDVPDDHRDNEWGRVLKLYVGMMQGNMEELKAKILTDMIVNQA